MALGCNAKSPTVCVAQASTKGSVSEALVHRRSNKEGRSCKGEDLLYVCIECLGLPQIYQFSYHPPPSFA